jgi:hypothetical protein
VWRRPVLRVRREQILQAFGTTATRDAVGPNGASELYNNNPQVFFTGLYPQLHCPP